MQNSERVTPLPFVPGELIFYVEGGARDIETLDEVRAMVDERGGTLVDRPSPGAAAQRSLDGDEPPPTLYRATFGGGEADPTADVERILSVGDELRSRAPRATAMPNWLVGGANNGPGGGSGAGPGARPVPITFTELPLDDDLVTPLRTAADETRQPIRLVILDAWNEDPEESARLQPHRPLLHALNDYCLDLDVPRGHIAPPNGHRAHQDDDPFPMPDHGIFAAHLAASIIEETRLDLSSALFATSPRPSGLPTGGYIALESWRVLDEYGVGDSDTLIRTLDAVAASIGEEERVIVNMSLVFTIPDILPILVRMLSGLWREQWGAIPLATMEEFVRRLPRNAPPESERLDRALVEAVRRLRAKGALIVAAAGNDSRGPNERYAASYPAAYDEVLSVTAAAHDGSGMAWYANLAAPGGVALYAGDVTPQESLDPTYPVVGPFTDGNVPVLGAEVDPDNVDGAVAWAGTSFAAPQASGLAALLWAANPNDDADAIAGRLRALASHTLPTVGGNGTPFIPLLQY